MELFKRGGDTLWFLVRLTHSRAAHTLRSQKAKKYSVCPDSPQQHPAHTTTTMLSRPVALAILFSTVNRVAVTRAAQEPAGPSQMCRDDAGPPWADDEATFGSRSYFDGTPAKPEGDCPAPLAAACATKSKKAAFLAGPVDCGGKGWYCRIAPQADFVPQGGFRDANFAHCNRTDADDSDTDGHCHGSDDDSVYGWWVRDHWFRGYAGRLTCCCDWDGLKGLTNRCDYRRKVVDANDLETCRDANEDHGKGYSGTCAAFKDTIPFEDPALKPGNQCWVVSNFADPSAVADQDAADPAGGNGDSNTPSVPGEDINTGGNLRGGDEDDESDDDKYEGNVKTQKGAATTNVLAPAILAIVVGAAGLL